MTETDLRSAPSPPSPPGEEELRFIRNFHDVFLSIGLAMFAVGLGIAASLVMRNLTQGLDASEWRRATMTVTALFYLNAAIMWALGEVFARTRRLFLPAIVILLAFIAFWFGGLASTYALLFLDAEIESLERSLTELKSLPLFLAAGLTLAIFAYYLRMRLPFAMGLGALSLAGTSVAALFLVDQALVAGNLQWIQLAAGVFLFLLGVAFDARDPLRLTRYSDNGFWLHFFAAPLIFGAVVSLVAGPAGPYVGDAYPAAAMLVVVTVFALISLLINRRALLVAGLISAAVSIAMLVSKTGLDGAWTAAVTLLALGGAMVLLGGGWHTVRRVLVAPFPKTGPIARVIPPEPEKDAVSE